MSHRGAWLWVFAALASLGCNAAFGTVQSIGHRGNSLFAPENTVAAFLACSNKADFVELDARVAKDGAMVVMHDATVDRTTDGTGNVSAMTLAELKALDAGSWFSAAFLGERIPTLEEAVTNILPFATPLIEHKAGSAAAYVAELERIGAVTKVIVQSFDWPFLSAVHALRPDMEICALGSGTFTSGSVTSITNTGARRVSWERAGVTQEMLDLAHQAGLKVFVWTVDGPGIKTFIDLGVDGIISNDPASVRQYQEPSTNGPVNLQLGLLTYWQMDDGLADPMADFLLDNRGANTAALVRGDGLSHWFGLDIAAFGGCLEVDGVTSFVRVPQSATLDIGTNALTLSAWLNLKRLPSQLATQFGAVFDSTNDCYVLYLDKGSKELRFKVSDVNNHAARPGIPESALQTNQWLHVVGTYSQTSPASGEARIYLNGQLADIHYGSDSTTPVGLTGNVKPGQNAAMGREGFVGGNYFQGLVDDFAIWTRALNPGEVAWLYGSGASGLSLRDLLRQPTSLILPRTAELKSGGEIGITFQNMGTWKNFRLLHANKLSGPFLPVYGLSPSSLGRGMYQFNYTPQTGSPEHYFRIEGN